jgi:hypothetical protein
MPFYIIAIMTYRIDIRAVYYAATRGTPVHIPAAGKA